MMVTLTLSEAVLAGLLGAALVDAIKWAWKRWRGCDHSRSAEYVAPDRCMARWCSRCGAIDHKGDEWKLSRWSR